MSASRNSWVARLGMAAPFLAAALIAVPASARASSAYSAGGLGEPSLEEPARLRALGGAGAAEHGPRAFSLVNPASVAEVDHLILEGTVMPSMRRVSALSFPSETARETVVPSLRALVRIPGRFTLGGAYLVGTNGRFGIDRPESSGAPSTLRIDGSGGIDLIRITLARRLTPSVNLGADYEVIVGSFREDWARDFVDPALITTRDTLETTWERQGRWRFGAQVHHGTWALGGVYELPRRLPLATTQRTAGTFVREEHRNLTIPSGFTVGGMAPLTDRLRAVGQYRRANWSRASLESDLADFRAEQRWSFGLELLPAADASRFLTRLPLRVGATVLTWPDLLVRAGATDVSGGTAGVKEVAFSVGTGLRSQDRGGAVDLSLEAGSRGDKDALGIGEKFVRFAVSLQVSDDTWK
ncbi:MAG TPA: hypothetical protein VE326_02280 [Candidatus Binatia bacterium]|nr:hypothetical protein [Candidatus Binatia bacterium]